MAEIKPFQAVRPADSKRAGRIAALPYDVYNRQEAKAEVQREPMSFLQVDRAETVFPDEIGTYEDCVYAKAKELLEGMIARREFIKEGKPCYYIYELAMNGRLQTGIVACASIDDYQNEVIKKHENTRADKEEDRIHHVDTCNAQTGPIFLAYRSRQCIDEIVDAVKQENTLYDFASSDGVNHRVWVIDNEADIAALHEAFAQIEAIYIADGHHRCASAVKVGLKRRLENPEYTGKEEFNYFLSVLFPHNQLMIMDYNRIVKDLNGLSTAEFMEKLSYIFEIKEKGKLASKPTKKGEIAMYLEELWYCLTVKREKKVSDPVEGLDVSLLQHHVLAQLLGIHNPKTDNRIDFVGGIRGLEELENRVHTDCKVAFAMYPTSIYELFAVADAGLLMPPKSTWFEPKLRSGLFIHSI